MPSLKQIKRRIASVKSTQQITRAMKMVAAARLRRAQTNIIKARPYSHKLRDVIKDLAWRCDRSMHPLLDLREPKEIGVIVVTSDRGLCGSFKSAARVRTSSANAAMTSSSHMFNFFRIFISALPLLSANR